MQINCIISYADVLVVLVFSSIHLQNLLFSQNFVEIPTFIVLMFFGAQPKSEIASVPEVAALHQQVTVETHPQGLAAEIAFLAVALFSTQWVCH